MDWKDLAGTLARTGAPIIGAALGGPLGGTIGGVIGNIVANALGVDPTPEAVNTAITTGDPATVQAQLSSADAQAAAKWDAITKIAQAQAEVDKVNIQQINETIRAENAQGVPWWHWRHLLGYVPVLTGVEVASLLPLFLAGKITPTDMVAVIGAITPFLTIVSALLGYVAQDTTKLKTVAMVGEHQDTITSSIAKVIAGKKK